LSREFARTRLSSSRPGSSRSWLRHRQLPRAKDFFLSRALSDQPIGFEEEQDGIWRINFMDLDLGFLDEETMKFSPISPEDSDHRLRKRDREHSPKVGNPNT